MFGECGSNNGIEFWLILFIIIVRYMCCCDAYIFRQMIMISEKIVVWIIYGWDDLIFCPENRLMHPSQLETGADIYSKA